MRSIDQIKILYFIGIGGIGMSALARFFKSQGKHIEGYDRTESELTSDLMTEGIDIVFDDNHENFNTQIYKIDTTLVVYTPAISQENKIFNWFKRNGYQIIKRSELLGIVSEKWNSICVAGTHGKTTVSTMTAHLLKQSSMDCSAFLGGISKNYNTNYLKSESSEWVVLEADEFDRSFLHLSPAMAVVTSVDADHLDIYENHAQIRKTFDEFINKVKDNGTVIIKKNVDIKINKDKSSVIVENYTVDEVADFYASNIKLLGGFYTFDIVHPGGVIDNIELGVPGLVNVENAVAAAALAIHAGVNTDEIKNGFKTFRGIKRRFDYWLKENYLHIIDDYAHHPEEIKATAKSVKAIYPDKKVVAIFQPHLYSRTKDFFSEFADALSLFDQVLLLDIYPARELPIEGVNAYLIANLVKVPVKVVQKSELCIELNQLKPDVIITMGAGDIDRELPSIVNYFKQETMT